MVAEESIATALLLGAAACCTTVAFSPALSAATPAPSAVSSSPTLLERWNLQKPALSSSNAPAPVSLSSRVLGWRAASVTALVINIVSVAIPGRFDGDPKVLVESPWPTIFNPAGFAFAIWGVIYLGELLGTAAIVLSRPSAALERTVAASNDAWLAANVAQALWCFAFRPWALSRLWVPMALLACTAGCLFMAQSRGISEASAIGAPQPSVMLRWLILAPRSLHLGWVTAAMLVNANAWVGYMRLGAGAALAYAILSIVVGALAAVAYQSIGATAGALAISWALFALSRGLPVGDDARVLGPVVMGGVARAEATVAAGILIALLLALLLPWLSRLVS